MNVKELKEIIKDLDDDTIVVVSENMGNGYTIQEVLIGITNKDKSYVTTEENLKTNKWYSDEEKKGFVFKAIELSCDF